MNILSKEYTGKFYIVAVVLTLVIQALASPAVADLGWDWVPLATQIVTVAAWLVQQFTSVGDTPRE